MNNHMKLRALCEGAVLVAVAQVLSFLKLWEMPWGGSVVLSMIPLVLYAVRWGLGAGLLGGFAFGVLQFMFDGGFAIGWQSIVGDYLVAFTVLGLAGLVARRKSGVFTGTLIAGFSRLLLDRRLPSHAKKQSRQLTAIFRYYKLPVLIFVKLRGTFNTSR